MRGWNPDTDLIDFWEDAVKRNSYRFNQKILRRGKILTWFDIIDEMRQGVPYGRRMYEMLCQTLKENPDIQKRFDDWKAIRND